jgi:hypothetical protein
MQNTTDSSWIIKGKRYHGRIISEWVKKKGGLNGLTRKEFLKKNYDENAIEFVTKGKIKYIYPLNKTLIPLCKSLSKPYPKNAQEVNVDKHGAACSEIGGSSPTLALNKKDFYKAIKK